MAEAVGLNLRQLRNGLLRATGKTPQRFVQERRIALAKSLIGSTAQTLAEIAAASGFADQAHMSRLFQREIGVAPSVWRAQIR
jgi:AraC-like DNA-binding protein